MSRPFAIQSMLIPQTHCGVWGCKRKLKQTNYDAKVVGCCAVCTNRISKIILHKIVKEEQK